MSGRAARVAKSWVIVGRTYWRQGSITRSRSDYLGSYRITFTSKPRRFTRSVHRAHRRATMRRKG